MGSICLAWLPTMYRKYQKSMRSMFLELEWGCLISTRGTLLCGCRVLKRGLLAEKSLFFSGGHPPTPGRTTPSHPVTPLTSVIIIQTISTLQTMAHAHTGKSTTKLSFDQNSFSKPCHGAGIVESQVSTESEHREE